MKIAIISKTPILKEILAQIDGFASFKFDLLDEQPKDNTVYDLIIVDEIPSFITNSNVISISDTATADLKKPFKITTLISMINEKLNQKVYKVQKFEFSPYKRLLNFNSLSISLTEKESNLIFYLIKYHPRKIPKVEILKELWNYSEDVETTTLEVHLSRLKQKLVENELPELISYKDKVLSIDL